jgi:hypothetical protein
VPTSVPRSPTPHLCRRSSKTCWAWSRPVGRALLVGAGGTGGTGLGLPAGIGGVAVMAAMLPLGSAAVSVEARSQAFVECHRGARTWRDVLRTGDITVSGRPALGRAFPTRNLHAPVVDPKFSRMAG